MWMVIFAGETLTKGDSPVQLCLQLSEQTAEVTLWWRTYDRIGFEEVLPLRGRSIQARVQDKHPVYDYTDSSTLRCTWEEKTARCRLPYTDWFELQPAPEGCVAARQKD